MDCRKVSQKLFAYIEDDLTPVEKNGLEEHLKICGFCQRKLADCKLLMAATKEIEPLSPGPHFVNRVLCAINQKRRPIELLTDWKYRLTLSGMAFAIAACLTFFIVGPPTSNWEMSTPRIKDTPSFSNQVENPGVQKGFPVPENILKRDMALVGKIITDSTIHDSIVLPKYYVQPVGIKRENNKRVF